MRLIPVLAALRHEGQRRTARGQLPLRHFSAALLQVSMVLYFARGGAAVGPPDFSPAAEAAGITAVERLHDMAAALVEAICLMLEEGAPAPLVRRPTSQPGCLPCCLPQASRCWCGPS